MCAIWHRKIYKIFHTVKIAPYIYQKSIILAGNMIRAPYSSNLVDFIFQVFSFFCSMLSDFWKFKKVWWCQWILLEGLLCKVFNISADLAYLIVSKNVFRSLISSGMRARIRLRATDFLFNSWKGSSVRLDLYSMPVKRIIKNNVRIDSSDEKGKFHKKWMNCEHTYS